MKEYFLITVISLFISSMCLAQNEVIREQNSLQGITEFGVVVNIEKPERLEELTLRVDSVRTLLLAELIELPVTILDDETLKESDLFPILHLHINVMYAMPGIYPFTAEMKFYQPVKLSLSNDIQTTAATWHNSFVGVVSPDLADIISVQSVKLVHSFRNDYLSAN